MGGAGRVLGGRRGGWSRGEVGPRSSQRLQAGAGGGALAEAWVRPTPCCSHRAGTLLGPKVFGHLCQGCLKIGV